MKIKIQDLEGNDIELRVSQLDSKMKENGKINPNNTVMLSGFHKHMKKEKQAGVWHALKNLFIKRKSSESRTQDIQSPSLGIDQENPHMRKTNNEAICMTPFLTPELMDELEKRDRANGIKPINSKPD